MAQELQPNEYRLETLPSVRGEKVHAVGDAARHIDALISEQAEGAILRCFTIRICKFAPAEAVAIVLGMGSSRGFSGWICGRTADYDVLYFRNEWA